MKHLFKLTIAALALASSTALMAVNDNPTSDDERTERFLSLQDPLQEKLTQLLSERAYVASLVGPATFEESLEIEATLGNIDAEIAKTQKALKDLDDMKALPAPENLPCVARSTQEENETEYGVGDYYLRKEIEAAQKVTDEYYDYVDKANERKAQAKEQLRTAILVKIRDNKIPIVWHEDELPIVRQIRHDAERNGMSAQCFAAWVLDNRVE